MEFRDGGAGIALSKKHDAEVVDRPGSLLGITAGILFCFLGAWGCQGHGPAQVVGFHAGSGLVHSIGLVVEKYLFRGLGPGSQEFQDAIPGHIESFLSERSLIGIGGFALVRTVARTGFIVDPLHTKHLAGGQIHHLDTGVEIQGCGDGSRSGGNFPVPVLVVLGGLLVLGFRATDIDHHQRRRPEPFAKLRHHGGVHIAGSSQVLGAAQEIHIAPVHHLQAMTPQEVRHQGLRKFT